MEKCAGSLLSLCPPSTPTLLIVRLATEIKHRPHTMWTALPIARRPAMLAAAHPLPRPRPARPAAAPALPPRRRPLAAAAAIAAGPAGLPPLPPLAAALAALPTALARLVATLARSLVMVAAAGAAATVAALAATGASSAAGPAAAHPALWALVAAYCGARLATRGARADGRRLRDALADHGETLAGIERGVSVSRRAN